MPPNKAQIKKNEKQTQEQSGPNAQSDSDVHAFLSEKKKNAIHEEDRHIQNGSD